ncbi:hypothetical protein EMIT0P258_50164 [Pseudomonas sp. IT-P258]
METTFQREEPMKSVVENGSDRCRSAVFLDQRLALDAGCLRGLGVLRSLRRHLDPMLFERRGTCGVMRDESLRFFRHRQWRQEQRGQNESAGNTHTVGHLGNLLAWQVLFGAGKDKDMRRGEKERIHERTVTAKAKIAGMSDREMDTEGIHPMIAAHEHIAAMHQRNRLDDGQPQAVIVAAVAA